MWIKDLNLYTPLTPSDPGGHFKQPDVMMAVL